MNASEAAVQAAVERALMASNIAKLEDTIVSLTEMIIADREETREMIREHRAETKELLEAFHNATFALSAVKWIGGAVGAVGGLVLLLSDHWPFIKRLMP